ncbi:thiamine transport system ATP-binding protein [Mesocricetibacter intestinalis]|uniref:Thiamine transport system ATP-binding protein n=1 Tax=Mesocricetibacter intestinalis TaxID=1521930 RepID=A0A4R6VG58_9PAST|nr:thiamine ABC transporter ATP-binding protein [Mesocricetibacter intestinalis]TDQ59862.1 thiamine transport system ATP-binding protein [Mesocricetibacter intestinalis]
MIKLEQVLFRYKSMSMQFSLHIRAGEKVAIVGESGAGKSTLLNLIAGFELPQQGEIILNGENHSFTQPFERPVSMLFQENNLFMHLNVEQNIALGLKPELTLTPQERKCIIQAASAVGLRDFLNELPTRLSGGQKQRVALARCLLREKPILLLDEPFSALDPELRREMLNLFLQLCDVKGLTLLIVTHQPQELEAKIDRIIRIGKGRIISEFNPKETI